MTNSRYDKYFEENPENANLIKEDRERRVFLETINGVKKYIKRYAPQKKRENLCIALKLRTDYATHYGKISRELKRIEIPHVQPVYIQKKSRGILKNISLLITEYGGEPMGEVFPELPQEKQLECMEKYFYYYKKMFFNGIYTTDYNIHGILIDGEYNLKLIDFDKYVYKKRPDRIFSNVEGKKYKKGLMKGFYSHHMEFAMGIENRKVREYIEAQICEIADLVAKFF